MAKHALDDGKTKAIILGGAIAGIGRCDNPASGTTKCDDLTAASPDADSIYALTGDYATSALTALDNHAAKMSVYVTDSTADTLQDLKDGKVVAGDGGSGIAVTLATTMLVNWLDGNRLKTADGKAPYIDAIVAFPINAESADSDQKYWLTENPLPVEQLNTVWDDGATMDTIDAFAADYS